MEGPLETHYGSIIDYRTKEILDFRVEPQPSKFPSIRQLGFHGEDMLKEEFKNVDARPLLVSDIDEFDKLRAEFIEQVIQIVPIHPEMFERIEIARGIKIGSVEDHSSEVIFTPYHERITNIYAPRDPNAVNFVGVHQASHPKLLGGSGVEFQDTIVRPFIRSDWGKLLSEVTKLKRAIGKVVDRGTSAEGFSEMVIGQNMHDTHIQRLTIINQTAGKQRTGGIKVEM